MYIKCNLCHCIGLLSFIYLVSGRTNSEFMKMYDLPKFILEPISSIYYSSNQLSISQFIPKFHLYALISPRNATIQLGAIHKDKPNMIIYLPTVHEYSTESYSMTFAQIHAKINSLNLSENLIHLNSLLSSTSITTTTNSNTNTNTITTTTTDNHHNSNNVNEDINLWSIFVYNFLPDMKLLILASTQHGTITSHLIDMKPSILPAFPLHSDKYLSLLIGNTAAVVCHLPSSQPSLPTVYFYHNNIRLDLTQIDRYRLIYIGGDDSGLPWEIFTQKPHFKKANIKKHKPSAAILLIHSLQLSDTGQYYCSVSLFDKTLSSNQRTHLVVTKPNEKIRTHLKFSSDDNDLTYLYTDETTNNSIISSSKNENTLSTMKEIKIYENTNLTLFCIFESAPVVSTSWYFEGFTDNIEINQKFGVLMINYARLENDGIYTCSVDNSHSKLIGKSFRVVVMRSPLTSSSNLKIITTEIGKQVTLNCNNNELQTTNVTNELNIPLPKSPSRDEWNKWNMNKMINNTKYPIENQYDKRIINYSSVTNQWIHNGQFITMNEVKNNYHLDDGILKILKVTKSHTGIYQYMKSNQVSDVNSIVNDNDESISCKFHIQLDHENTIHNVTNDQVNTIFEYTLEGLTGHLNCNLSTLLLTEEYQNTNGYNEYQWSILWYRSVTSNEPLNIESINKASGGIKYIISNVNEYTQILSIVNPKKVTDDGQYICRVYNTTTGKLLGEQRFQLIIESNNDDEMHKNKMKHELLIKKQNRNELPKKSNNNNEKLPLKQSIHHEKPQIKVSQPIIKRLANFTMAIHMKWIVYNSPIEKLHYQLGIKQLGQNRHIRSLIIPSNQYIHSENQSNLEQFSILPNIYENSSIIIDSRDLFQPKHTYCLRVLVLEHQLWSPWTEPVNFNNMLDTTLQIISLGVNNASCLYVEWIYIQSRNSSFTSDMTDIKDMKFMIIYRNLSGNPSERKSLLELWTELVLHNNEKEFPVDLSKVNKLGDLHIRQIIGDSSMKGHLIDGLPPNTTYAVSIYIEVTKMSQYQQQQQQKYFTRLSNEAVQRTLPNVISSSIDENNHITENPPKEKINKPEDLFIQSKSYLKSKMIKQIDNQDDLSSKLAITYQHESYVLIVILGSLAGVLFIIFIALITFCIWYRLRLKSQYPREYFRAFSPTQLNETSKQRTITEWENFQSHPAPTTDNHQTFPRTASNLHLQPLGDQQTMITDMNSFSTLQHPTNWIHQSQVPGNGQYRKSMFIDDTNKTYWPIINSNEAKLAFIRNQNHDNVINNSILPHIYKDYLLKPTNHGTNMQSLENNEVGNSHLGSLEGIFQGVIIGEQFNNTNRLSNKDAQLTNDQSSSIYSHIDSDSTVNDLCQLHLEKFNSTLSPTVPSNYSGINRSVLNMQNNNLNHNNNNKEIRCDFSQPTNLSFTTSSVYPFIAKQDDVVSSPLINQPKSIQNSIQTELISNDPSSFYTTVPPFRHLQYPFNITNSSSNSALLNSLDHSIFNHLNMPIHQYNNNNNNNNELNIQQTNLMKPFQVTNNKQSVVCSTNLMNYITTPYSIDTNNLTATLTLQEWIENMSKPDNHLNDNNILLYNEICKQLNKQTNLQLNKIDQQNISNENNQHHKSPRENLSSSFADSGVDLPNTSNLESDLIGV
ncbi:immunoglobulin domain-containing-like protein isoform 2 [Schistosoma japonicum]|uniref:Immunoglobulin domain-containing-like protein isoform 2 n=1 Tax=Schistosoma japonicum TaxID=6182 RepID=A0A4Z2DKQ6_SCHJA|nr:immunoglobulin domain-containing-like protein isoform 2 [Schistosoma japonicum]TNN16987.1 immunoglobulin domain-containing-like protein isoform 2 [Schistosoma japonicum]